MSRRAVRITAQRWWRWLMTVLAAAVVASACPAGAAPMPAPAPPGIDPALVPPPLPPRPPEPSQRASVCQRLTLVGGPPRTAPAGQRQLGVEAAWQFGRGQGQTVAVIGTGVNRHPRLPNLVGGGDYVSDTDGTEDCDGHGTVAAGLIAAQSSAHDGFAGIAPESAVIAIRQSSLAYEVKDYNHREGPGRMAIGGYGTTATLASAIVHAVEMGATVINVTEVACAVAGADLNDGALGAAVKLAYDRNVVVVVAAGDLSDTGPCSVQNENGRYAVKTVVSPAYFSPYVLAVGATDPDGGASPFSLFGPWVSVAAPGRGIVSLDSSPGSNGLVDAIPAENTTRSIDGTSFSSAYVAGVVALVRSRFPALSAREVMERVVRTAHSPGAGRDDRLGAGLVDPVAALTAQLPQRDVHVGAGEGTPVAAPEPSPRQDPWPKRIALIGTLACLGALAIGYVVGIPYRRDGRKTFDD
ncbi:type VII secretion-associated serine protease mycosin [Nocardia asiatica]|uniref:type VII secretion-associated serine protease mycosin n=1 Tax=Nocardia asiatica TaxID=209252 RepID=UPI002454BB68|nr:type VII secretion-associated serine protease mycosin [Nocardia asiatica]